MGHHQRAILRRQDGVRVPDIAVTGNGSFGSTPYGTADNEVFAVQALNADIVITAISVPTGFSHDAVLPWTVEAGTSENFTVTSTATVIGSFSGNVSITSNDPDENPFTFAVSSTVTPPTTNLDLWLDANDLATLWQDSGRTTPAASNADVIGAWDDKSSNARHLTQGTTGNKPTLRTSVINSKNVIRFVTDDYLSRAIANGLAANGDFSLYVAWKSSSTTDGVLYGEGSTVSLTPQFLSRINNSSAGRLDNQMRDDASTSRIYGFNGSYNNGAGHQFSDIRAGGSSVLRVDKVQRATSSANPSTNTVTHVGVGALVKSSVSLFLDGDIAEILLYSDDHDSTTRDAIEAYFSAKYGI